MPSGQHSTMPTSGKNFPTKRKFPRLSWKQKGEMTFKDELGDPVLVRVDIRSISPEGLGLSASSDAELPKISGWVQVSFQIGQRDIELPGRLVWRQRAATHSAMGIHLKLELAKASMRHAYASWIVDRLKRSRQEQTHPRIGSTPQPA